MDGGDTFLAVAGAMVLALFVGLFAYNAGRDNVREQAIASGKACYKIASELSETRPAFSWDCKKPDAKD